MSDRIHAAIEVFFGSLPCFVLLFCLFMPYVIFLGGPVAFASIIILSGASIASLATAVYVYIKL